MTENNKYKQIIEFNCQLAAVFLWRLAQVIFAIAG